MTLNEGETLGPYQSLRHQREELLQELVPRRVRGLLRGSLPGPDDDARHPRSGSRRLVLTRLGQAREAHDARALPGSQAAPRQARRHPRERLRQAALHVARHR